MSLKPIAYLKRWHEVREGGYSQLIGFVHGHPSFSEGYYIKTSDVLDMHKNRKTAETRNTIYILVEEVNINNKLKKSKGVTMKNFVKYLAIVAMLAMAVMVLKKLNEKTVIAPAPVSQEVTAP